MRQFVARIGAVWLRGTRAFWARGCWGKAAVGIVHLLVLTCVFGAFVPTPDQPADMETIAAVASPSSDAFGVLPAATTQPATPTTVPTDAPTATTEPTVVPSAVLPTDQPTSAPTAEPTVIPPTDAPAVAAAPVVRDQGYAPCEPNQIKANRNSGIFHAPGQRDYGKTTADVQCFDTEAEAVAAGYRKAKR